jgi:hypothetical protein
MDTSTALLCSGSNRLRVFARAELVVALLSHPSGFFASLERRYGLSAKRHRRDHSEQRRKESSLEHTNLQWRIRSSVEQLPLFNLLAPMDSATDGRDQIKPDSLVTSVSGGREARSAVKALGVIW